MACSAYLSYRDQDHHPRDSSTHHELDPLYQSLIRKCCIAGSHGDFSLTEAPSSLMCPACVKLTHKTRQHRLVGKGSGERNAYTGVCCVYMFMCICACM